MKSRRVTKEVTLQIAFLALTVVALSCSHSTKLSASPILRLRQSLPRSIQSVIDAHSNEIEPCLIDGAPNASSKKVAGWIDFTVDGNGNVQSAEKRAGQEGDESVYSCVIGHVTTWKFEGTGATTPYAYFFHSKQLGVLSKDAIRQLIRSRASEVRLCYEQAISRERKRSLQGKIAVEFVTQPGGEVSNAAAILDTVACSSMTQCVVNRLSSWQFPKPSGGGVVLVTYPFIFIQRVPVVSTPTTTK